jgi:four helix bundle protein
LRETEDGRRETEDGRRKTEDGRRKTGDGRRKTEDGRRETEDGRREKGDGRRKTEEGRREKGEGRRRRRSFLIFDIMKFKFEKLLIWQKSMDFGEDINKMVISFPRKEQYNLASQIMRAVDSVALNISEGTIGQSNPESKKFISYSIRSLAEVVTCLHKAIRRKYISEDEFNKHYDCAFNLMNMIVAFRNKIE